jgi:sugar-specific transcriptional regulator TrmB
MAGNSDEQLEYECVSLLKEFGLSEYEAYTFVYLLRLGSGTAKDVADVDGVPRTRVYDAVDTLHEAGLVDVQYSSPKRFTPVSRETAVRKLELQRENSLTELRELFDRLDPVDPHPEEFGVWTVVDRAAVASRLVEFMDDAEDEIIYMTVDELLTDDHLDALTAADARGVDIHLGNVSDEVEARILDDIPSTNSFETAWRWAEEGAGSLLITDRRTALVSVLVDRGDTSPVEETAIWGTGEQNSLVVVLRAIFTWRL